MILSFLLGLAAGLCERMVEPHVKRAVEDVFDVKTPVERSEYDVLTLLLLLLVAVALASLLTTLWPMVLLVGAFLGLFGLRFYEALTTKNIRPGRRES